jgi:hypothetical protein
VGIHIPWRLTAQIGRSVSIGAIVKTPDANKYAPITSPNDLVACTNIVSFIRFGTDGHWHRLTQTDCAAWH